MACKTWLGSISANAVYELHVAGHITTTDLVIDDHGSRVSDSVWQLYRHAQMRFGNVPVLIKWDTDIPPLAVLLDVARLARITHSASAALAAGA